MKVLKEGALIPYALIIISNLSHFSGSVFLYIFFNLNFVLARVLGNFVTQVIEVQDS